MQLELAQEIVNSLRLLNPGFLESKLEDISTVNVEPPVAKPHFSTMRVLKHNPLEAALNRRVFILERLYLSSLIANVVLTGLLAGTWTFLRDSVAEFITEFLGPVFLATATLALLGAFAYFVRSATAEYKDTKKRSKLLDREKVADAAEPRRDALKKKSAVHRRWRWLASPCQDCSLSYG